MKYFPWRVRNHSSEPRDAVVGTNASFVPIVASCGSEAFARCARLVPKLVPLFGMCSQPMR